MDTDKEDIKKLEAVLKADTYESVYTLQCKVDQYLSESDIDSSDDEADYKQSLIIDESEEITIPTDLLKNLKSKSHTTLTTIRNFVTEEELIAINDYPDPELRRTMILNRAKQIKQKNLLVHYTNLFQKCSNSMREEQIMRSEKGIKSITSRKNAINRLGFPYFKTKKGFRCPPNGEMVEKNKRGELNPDYLLNDMKWTMNDQVALRTSICVSYHSKKIEKQADSIRELKSRMKLCDYKDEEKALSEEIEEKTIKLNALKEEKEYEVPPIDYEVNWEQVSSDLKNKHPARNCKAFWTQVLHPSLNHNMHSVEEDAKLVKLATKHKFQNWDAIASELNTNRSPLQVCINYFASFNRKFNTGAFTPKEDHLLCKLLDEFHIGSYIPWAKVDYHFEGRCRTQLYQRYMSQLCYGDVVKGHFTKAEDVLLFCLLKKFGKNFKLFREYMPGRSVPQLRSRCKNYLDNLHIIYGNWTYEEDKKVMEHVQTFGTAKWGDLAVQLNRNRYHVRQRYITLELWQKRNPNMTLEDIERKQEVRWDQKRQEGLFIKQVSEVFNGRIPTIEEIESILRKKQMLQNLLKSGAKLEKSDKSSNLAVYKVERTYTRKNDLVTVKQEPIMRSISDSEDGYESEKEVKFDPKILLTLEVKSECEDRQETIKRLTYQEKKRKPISGKRRAKMLLAARRAKRAKREVETEIFQESSEQETILNEVKSLEQKLNLEQTGNVNEESPKRETIVNAVASSELHTRKSKCGSKPSVSIKYENGVFRKIFHNEPQKTSASLEVEKMREEVRSLDDVLKAEYQRSYTQ